MESFALQEKTLEANEETPSKWLEHIMLIVTVVTVASIVTGLICTLLINAPLYQYWSSNLPGMMKGAAEPLTFIFSVMLFMAFSQLSAIVYCAALQRLGLTDTWKFGTHLNPR